MQVIWNTTNDEHKNKLKELFKNALKFECAVAFAKMSGFTDIKKPLEDFLKRGMPARFILGLDFCITDPEVLNTLLEWESKYEIKTYISIPQSNVCFHPKIYAFSYSTHSMVLAGSANLTSGGLGDNWECSLLVRQNLENKIVRHLQTLIDDGEVHELTCPKLADYRKRHRVARAVRSAAERQIARLTRAGKATLEPLEAIVRELKLDNSSHGLDSMTRTRSQSIKEARNIISRLRQNRHPPEDGLLPDIRALRECFHSGGLQRHIPKILRQSTEFLKLLNLAHRANMHGSTPKATYELLQPVALGITGLGPNWVTEILHALDPSKYAVLNQNSVAGMALAGIEFPAKPNKTVISGDIYGEFCKQGIVLVESLKLQDLSALDVVFNHAYWNHDNDDG